jgi:hypothetical protein
MALPVPSRRQSLSVYATVMLLQGLLWLALAGSASARWAGGAVVHAAALQPAYRSRTCLCQS